MTPFSLNLDNLAKNTNDTIQTKIIYIFCTSLQIFILVERIEVVTCLETMYRYLIKITYPIYIEYEQVRNICNQLRTNWNQVRKK